MSVLRTDTGALAEKVMVCQVILSQGIRQIRVVCSL